MVFGDGSGRETVHNGTLSNSYILNLRISEYGGLSGRLRKTTTINEITSFSSRRRNWGGYLLRVGWRRRRRWIRRLALKSRLNNCSSSSGGWVGSLHQIAGIWVVRQTASFRNRIRRRWSLEANGDSCARRPNSRCAAGITAVSGTVGRIGAVARRWRA